MCCQKPTTNKEKAPVGTFSKYLIFMFMYINVKIGEIYLKMFELGGVSPCPAWSGPASDGRTAPETACYLGVRSAQRGDKREQSRYVGSC